MSAVLLAVEKVEKLGCWMVVWWAVTTVVSMVTLRVERWEIGMAGSLVVSMGKKLEVSKAERMGKLRAERKGPESVVM